MRRAVALFVLALPIVAACKPSAAAGNADASLDARAMPGSRDGGPIGDASAAAANAEAGALAVDTELPPAASEELTARARHLFEAIAQDNPDLGVDLLFPRDAWIASRDATDPGKQWDAKVAPGFRRAVHTLHKRTKGIERAQFVSFEIGRTVTQATLRRKEWKLPLWRVGHGRITFTLDGRTLRWDVDELAAWKGAWYVTRLR